MKAVEQKLFGDMMEKSSSCVTGSRALHLPSEFSEASAKKISFQAKFYGCSYGQLRSVYIQSPKVEIFNLFFFPKDENESPVYAMEFVRMGVRMIVAVIDVVGDPDKSSAASYATSIIAPHRERYSSIPQGDDPPEWFQECRSGCDFFVRPSGVDQMLALEKAHYAVFSSYIQTRAEWPNSDRIATGVTWQARYKSHHAANSPGLPFLNRTFGEDWTQEFLHQHLFS